MAGKRFIHENGGVAMPEDEEDELSLIEAGWKEDVPAPE